MKYKNSFFFLFLIFTISQVFPFTYKDFYLNINKTNKRIKKEFYKKAISLVIVNKFNAYYVYNYIKYRTYYSRISRYRRIVLSKARTYIGTPYYFGGTSYRGIDCSGFTYNVFKRIGINLPRTADAQYNLGIPVAKKDLKPGDLVFFSTYTYGVSHVGIYIGNGKFIHASSSKGVTITSLNNPYFKVRYIGAKRIIR